MEDRTEISSKKKAKVSNSTITLLWSQRIN